MGFTRYLDESKAIGAKLPLGAAIIEYADLSYAGVNMDNLNEQLSVVILTYNRVDDLTRTLDQLFRLTAELNIIVINNASTDSTKETVEQRYPQVRLINMARNMGAAARNIGVKAAATPYIAFCDDDSWWGNGSLEKAVEILNAHPKLAAVCGRILLGKEKREDPICRLMAMSPLPSNGLPGPALLGFVACAVVFRRDAYLEAGGYQEKFFVGGEEELLSLDLVTAGWHIAYVPQLTVFHFPSTYRNNSARQKIVIRNTLWVAWLRLPFVSALNETRRIWKASQNKAIFNGALISALSQLLWVLNHRKVLPPHIHTMYKQLRP